jgi:hypothetical protein
MTDDDLIRHLLDLATESLDYGSGFMDNDDVETLRAAAVRVGVDPWTVTPDNHKPNYCPGHDWPGSRTSSHGRSSTAAARSARRPSTASPNRLRARRQRTR